MTHQLSMDSYTGPHEIQRSVRHVSPLTTTVHTHPSDEELLRVVRDIFCWC